MAINTQIITIRNNLHTQLTARSNLNNVKVFKYTPIDEAPKTEMIYFGDVNTSMDHQAFGKVYEEDLDLKIFIYVLKAGAGDTVASACETRAIALANEVVDQLADDITINNSAIDSRVRNINVQNTLSDEGRICLIEMDIEAETSISE
jgi:hypothetical protein